MITEQLVILSWMVCKVLEEAAVVYLEVLCWHS